MTENTTKTARLFLGINGLFSLLIALELLLFTQEVSMIMFLDALGWGTSILASLGVGLLVFAAYLAALVANRFVSQRAVMMIVYADIGWLVISALVVLFYGHLITERGVLIIDLVAILVAVCAVGQYVGGKRIIPPKSCANLKTENGILLASVHREVTAPAHRVWAVMNDHPAYADVAGNLSKVEVISGDGLGMVRRCFGLKGESWTEICNGYEAEQFFSFLVHTDAEDYPYPFQTLNGRWSMKDLGDRVEFSIEITAQPKGNWLACAMVSLGAKVQFKGVLIDLADGWAKRMEQSAN